MAAVGHQNGIASCQAEVGGQRGTLIASLFLDDLNEKNLTTLDYVLDLVATTQGHPLGANFFDFLGARAPLSAGAPALAATLQLAAGLAVDERPDGAWHAEWPTLQELLRLSLGTAQRTAALAEGLTLHPERARGNLDATGGAILSERLAIHLTPLIGRERFDALIADGAGGLRARVAALPEAAELDLDALFDPAGYLGVAGRVTDDIVREARDGGSR